jgi:hypothetical protein
MRSSRTIKRERDSLGVPGRDHILYTTWKAMRYRCSNPRWAHYENYGGRGITVCDQWNNDFVSFYLWAMDCGWKVGLQLDRINNDGSYSPGNCRWVTHQKNQNNRGNNVRFNFNGEMKTPREIFVEVNPVVAFNVFHDRLTHGWAIEEAANKPKQKYIRRDDNERN